MAIPEGWETVSLSDCGDGIRPAIKAGPFGSALKKSSYVKDGYRVYGQEQVIANDFSVGDYFVDDEKFSALRACAVHPGDVLISLVGTFGRVAIVPRNASPGIINPRLVRIAPDASRIDSGYLAVYIQSPIVQKVLVETAQGGTMGVLNATTLSKLSVTLPPLPEQKKIAAILSSVDEVIAKTEAVIAQLQIVKKAMMEQLLTKGMPGRHTRFKQTEIGEIPEEWEVVPLGKVSSVERGKFSHRPRNDPKMFGGEFPFIQTGDVAACDGRITTYSQTLNAKGLLVSRLFPAGTIVITIAANIGDTGIATVDVAFPDSLVGIWADSRMDNRFLELVLRSRKHSLDAAAPQNAQKNINLQVLRPLLIQVPELSEQKQIADCIDALSQASLREQELLQTQQTLKSALSSSLLSGEIRVIPEVA